LRIFQSIGLAAAAPDPNADLTAPGRGERKLLHVQYLRSAVTVILDALHEERSTGFIVTR
jgi:hypothetical protein